jgi:RNA polymerase sigma-70 factor (ECF subfamily)
MDGGMPDHELFLTLLLRHEPTIRASIRTVVQRPEDVDEIMQSTSLVAWKKFDSLTEHEAFGRWARVIARHEVLKFQRTKARDRFVLDTDLVERILEEAEGETDTSGRRLSWLEQCLEKLPEPRRTLLLQSYMPGSTIRSIAGSLGREEDALYQMLRRLRLELRGCIEKGLQEEGGPS